MATGDTVSGQLTVFKKKASGSEPKVAGSFTQSSVDTFSDNAENKVYLNTGMVQTKTSPLQATDQAYPNAKFAPGETIRIVHYANTDGGTRTIDVSADSFAIGAVEKDLNASRGSSDRVFPSDLAVRHNEVSSNTAPDTEGATIFEYTVPDRTEVYLAGAFEVAAVEA